MHHDPLGRCTTRPLAFDDAKLEPIPLRDDEQRRIAFIDDFVKQSSQPSATTRVPPAISGSPQELVWDVPSAKYERARLLFEKRHYADAALAFRDFTFAHRERSETIYTSQLYLEALNVIASHASPKRRECYDAMADDLRRFDEFFCQPVAPERREYCETLGRVKSDLQRLR